MNELQIYCAATRLPNAERDPFIQAACAKQPQLLERVRALFEAKTRGSDPVPPPSHQAAGKSILARTKEDVLIVYLSDARILDEARINEIGAELIGLIQRCPGRKMVLNFHAVTVMSSSLLGKVINLHGECRKAQIELRLCEIAPNIMQVFKFTKLTAVLNIHPTEPKAIAAFNKHGFFASRK